MSRQAQTAVFAGRMTNSAWLNRQLWKRPLWRLVWAALLLLSVTVATTMLVAGLPGAWVQQGYGETAVLLPGDGPTEQQNGGLETRTLCQYTYAQPLACRYQFSG